MAYNTKQYWVDKDKRAKVALAHTQYMEENYADEIEECVSETVEYDPDFNFSLASVNDRYEQVQIEVCDMDSVSAILKYTEVNKTAVLNFSSYKNPGGMFLKGSKAQEECLCHESYLYNVLRRVPDFYEYNKQHKNKALYLNRGMHTCNVLFLKDDDYKYCNVITCAAPNKKAAQKFCKVTDRQNFETLRSRIEFVFKIAAYNDNSILILGAYGCGVFAQDPVEVAECFKEFLYKYPKVFEKVVFAIPDKNGENYKAFEEVFNGKA